MPVPSGRGRPTRALDVDAAVERAARKFMSDAHAVGLSVGVYRGGKTYTYNYGEVAKGKGRLPTPHTIYEIVSITKTFTGVLLAQAVVEKRLRLDDGVRRRSRRGVGGGWALTED